MGGDSINASAHLFSRAKGTPPHTMICAILWERRRPMPLPISPNATPEIIAAPEQNEKYIACFIAPAWQVSTRSFLAPATGRYDAALPLIFDTMQAIEDTERRRRALEYSHYYINARASLCFCRSI